MVVVVVVVVLVTSSSTSSSRSSSRSSRSSSSSSRELLPPLEPMESPSPRIKRKAEGQKEMVDLRPMNGGTDKPSFLAGCLKRFLQMV